jgi:hypothetical protein
LPDETYVESDQSSQEGKVAHVLLFTGLTDICAASSSEEEVDNSGLTDTSYMQTVRDKLKDGSLKGNVRPGVYVMDVS